MRELSDEQLLQRHLQGISACFELLVRRHSQDLFHFLYRLLGSAAAAEDIVQETFLQVHVAAASFDQQRKFRPWLFTIAANKARDLLRGQKRRPEVPLNAQIGWDAEDSQSYSDLLAGPDAKPSIRMEGEERSYQIRQLVGKLPAPLKEVLILGYYHGFAYREMAEILNLPLGTIKSRLHAAVGAFGRLYEQSKGLNLQRRQVRSMQEDAER